MNKPLRHLYLDAVATPASASPVIDSYALSPMQAGMLYQTILSQSGAGSAGYDIEQIHISLAEDVDAATLGQAFTAVANAHAALATSFAWEGEAQPLQRVHGDVTVPMWTEDWSEYDESERALKRAEFLARDRVRGFDLGKPPLMRVAVFSCSAQHSEVVWTVHHILIDGRSFAPLLGQVFDAYRAFASDLNWQAPPQLRPYRDYIDWLKTRDTRANKLFFRELLAGKTAPTPLPVAKPVSPQSSRPEYGSEELIVPTEIVAGLERSAKHAGASLGMAVQAALAVVLSRFTCERDILFGVTRSIRRSALDGDAASMVGIFINTLPVRIETGEDGTVADLLRTIQQHNVALRSHEHTSLVDIQSESEIPRGTALFDTLLMFDDRELNQTLRSECGEDWQQRHVTVHEQPSFPLNFVVVRGETLAVRVLYDRRRFDAEPIARLTAAMVLVLQRFAENADSLLRDIDVLPAQERSKIVSAWNDTARTFPDQLRIHEFFERQAEIWPGAIAVEMDGKTLTYRELEEKANRLAHALRDRGAAPGKYVAICLERGLDLVVALLGVAKSGSPYVPLDPTYPPDRLAFMVEDTAALVVVTQQKFAALFNAPGLFIDEESCSELSRFPVDRPAPVGSSDDVCYAIYTSGSTGTPKGVVLTHKAVANTLDWVTRSYAVSPGDRLLFVTSPCFDLSVYDVFGVLGAGATVVVASGALLDDPRALAQAITEQDITIWDSAPAALQRLVPFMPTTPSRRSSLRLVMLSGDWIPLTLPPAVVDAYPNAKVKSLGGATEAAIWSNHFSIENIDPAWASIPYGKPIQNARYHVLDAGMRPVSVGVAGDLYIGGTCLASGYFNRPELTAERFLPDHLSGRPGDRLYMTGDRARYMEDGNLEFLGRADSQVKIRGYRVEIGEVESTLAMLPEVRAAACMARSDASGTKSLVAYVVPAWGACIDPDCIKLAAARKLPDFMVPSQIIVLDEMPISSNGKLDRKALPDAAILRSETAFVPLRSDFEKTIAAIFGDLLQTESIGATDDFFALGGHSLLAVILISRVRKAFGVDLPLSALLDHPTVESLADAIARRMEKLHHTKHLVALNRNGTRAPIILLPGLGGYAYTFKRLADTLAPHHPVWALHLMNTAADVQDDEISVEQMADIYIEEILEAFPDGPIILGGYSFGVLPAFELAHRLTQRGRQVKYLISFDGFAPGYPKKMTGLRWAHAHLRALVEKGNVVEYARARFANLLQRSRKMLGIAVAPSKAIAVFEDASVRAHLERLRTVNIAALNRYKPAHRLNIPLLLFRPEIQFDWVATDFSCPMHGWYEFIRGPICECTLRGEHLTLFSSQNINAMAKRIDAFNQSRTHMWAFNSAPRQSTNTQSFA